MSTDFKEIGALVVVNESAIGKAGFAGEYAPRAVFASNIGRSGSESVRIGMTQIESYIGKGKKGNGGRKHREPLPTINYPIRPGGRVDTSWDNVEKISHHTFYNEEHSTSGIRDVVYNRSMQHKTDIDIRRDLQDDVVLSGSTSMYPGIADRMLRELASLVPTAKRVNVIAPAVRKYSVSYGDSTLSSMSTLPQKRVSKQ